MDFNMVEIDHLFQQLLTKKVIIYGAGKIGKSLISILSRHSIPISGIWDNNFQQYDKLFPINVTKPQFECENKENTIIFVTIYAQKVSEYLVKELIDHGFKNIVYERKILNKIFLKECVSDQAQGKFKFNLDKCHLCPVSKDVENRCTLYDIYVEKEMMRSKKTSTGLIIPSMGILVSNKCNLSCEGCNQLRDFYTASDTLDICAVDILSDMHKISHVVDKIEKVVIVGGESLLHKEIYFITESIMDIDNIGIIQFITNGTVLPQDDAIFKLLCNPRVKVEISGYGDFLSAKLKQNVERFMNKLNFYNVNFDYVKTLQWFDFGDFKKRNYSLSEWQDVYNTCCFISNDLFNGELHKCARSAFGKHLHKIPECTHDYVDIRGSSLEELSKSIKAFLENTRPDVCQYCNGTSSLTIPAGKQSKRR